MPHYWVGGGVYEDTEFTKIARGGAVEWLGPYDDYEKARAVWAKRSWDTVDDVNARYYIKQEPSEAELAEAAYWVVGGTYTDTSFTTVEHPAGECWYGPFTDYEDAKAEWAKRSWGSVDDAYVRYRIDYRVNRPGGGSG